MKSPLKPIPPRQDLIKSPIKLIPRRQHPVKSPIKPIKSPIKLIQSRIEPIVERGRKRGRTGGQAREVIRDTLPPG